MKIGQFAIQNETSIDTIRHYISLGLIIPEKHNTQFDFDDKCTIDFQEITALKKIGFSLNEIQQLMLYRRIGKLTGYDRRITYTSFFERKKTQIDNEIIKLDAMRQNLESALNEMNREIEIDKSIDFETLGIPLQAIELLCCPHCHLPLNILDGKVQNGQLIDAKLQCDHHHQFQIIDGILFIENAKNIGESDYKGTDLNLYSEAYIDEYINTTDINYLKKLHEGLQWSSRHIAFEGLTDEIGLELGSGHGYFMRHMIECFPSTFTYIAIDHDLTKLRWLKKIIERSHPKCTILFICADFLQIPLKPKTIDVLFDISGSSNYAFDHTEFLLKKIDELVKDQAHLHAFYILFKNYVTHSKVPQTFRDGFNIHSIQSNLKELNYHCTEDFETESVEKGGPLENYFVEGEHVSTYFYSGIKVKKPLG